MRAVAAIAGMLLGGCFSPSFGEGQFICGPQDECPPGFRCDGAGACVRDPAGGTADAAADAFAAGPDASTAPDARAPQPPRLYTFDTETSTWSRQAAASYFNGAGGPDGARVQTAWSHCAVADAPVVCAGTDEQWHCTDDDGDSWYVGKWVNVLFALEANPPTFTTAFDTGGFLDAVWFTSGERWWEGRYFQPPTRTFGTNGDWGVMLETSYESAGRDLRDVEWAEMINAPPNGSAITADYERAGTWYLWTADGTEYSFDDGVWNKPVAAAFLAEPGAPPAELITAATLCDDSLYVVTRSDQ